MEIPSEGACASTEGTPLYSTAADDGKSNLSIVLMTVSLAIVYTFGILPLALPSSVAPTLEADATLAWTKQHTEIFMSCTLIAEGIGTLLLGWLPDALGGSTTMVLYMISAGICMVGVALQPAPAGIISLWITLALIRGMAWPAAMKIATERLPIRQWEFGILVVALASRSGDLLSAEAFSATVAVLGWRGILYVVAALQVVCGVGYWAVDYAIPMPVEYGSAGSRWSPSKFCAKVKMFFAMPDTWLIFGLVLLVQAGWVFKNFAPTFAHDIYAVSPADAAAIGGAFQAGQIVVLLVGIAMVNSSSPDYRRKIYALSLVLIIVCATIPALLHFVDFQVKGFVFMSWLAGFSFTLLDYLPASLWCMYAGRSNGNASLYMSLLFCPAFIAGTFCNWLIGHLRTQYYDDITVAYNTMLVMMGVFFLGCACLMAAHMRNQWQTPLLATRAGSKQPTV